jgi:D-3-phosphoglycerate dehydrogenase
VVADRYRIVATGPVPPIATEKFADMGIIEVAQSDLGRTLPSADVLIVRNSQINGELLRQARGLQAIARTGVGVENVDLQAATQLRIPVIYCPDAGLVPMAEGTMALIFATFKRLLELRTLLQNDRWNDRYAFEVRDVRNSTLGILGFGRIGSEVARLASAMGMRILAHDNQPLPEELGFGVGSVSLRELFQNSDVVSIHCDLNDTTRGLVDAALLSVAKPGAVLINVSRGAVIADDQVLIDALDKGLLSAIGLDVFATEPPVSDSPLLHDPRIICTPHAIGLSQSWNERVFSALARDVRLVLQGGRPENVANPEFEAPLTGVRGSGDSGQ